jgi:hypothetical protein
MITNIGKNILAKYLIGQAPAYASHIAIGCGAKPLASDGVLGDYSSKESLDFEMFRVPITSRGYVTENGKSKIVFTAELPTAERYEITEVGVWSAGANPAAGAYDSKTVYSFSETENWEYHSQTGAVGIQSIYEPLDSGSNPPNNIIATANTVFQTNADNKIFTNQERSSRYERCRFLNNVMVIKGDMSNLSLANGIVGIPTGSNHIHLTGASLDFNKNAPADQLKLAFSVINKNGESSIQPDEVRVVVEFSDTDEANATNAQYARLQVVLKETDLGIDFATNRYFVSSVALQNLIRTSGFTWNIVDTVKFYITVIKNDIPSDNYYVCLDALRLENISSSNPVYGLSGYSVIKNTNSETIIKNANTTNHIEFRFGMGVV